MYAKVHEGRVQETMRDETSDRNFRLQIIKKTGNMSESRRLEQVTKSRSLILLVFFYQITNELAAIIKKEVFARQIDSIFFQNQ